MKKRIGIVSTGWNDEYQRKLLEGITGACSHYNIDTLSFTSINIDFTTEAQNRCAYNIFNLIDNEYLDGLILAINTIYYKDVIENILQKAAQMNIPIVCLDHEYDNMMSVGTDNYTSARIMVEHLLDIDERKRYACIAGVTFNPESEARVQAFKDIMLERFGSYDDDYIYYQGNFQYDGGRDAAEHWYHSEKGMPDAVFCCNDKMAIGFMEKCQAYGYRIPEDIKIVGFDNSMWGQIIDIPMSSMQCPLNEIGQKAVEMLNAVFEGKEPTRKERIPGIPLFRKSSDASAEFTIDEYRNLYRASAIQTRNENESLFVANLMIERFSFCNSIDEFLHCLEDIVHRIACDEFYLCFTKEQMLSMGESFPITEDKHFGYMLEGYSSYMYMLVHYECGTFFEPQIFKTEKILPIFETPKDNQVNYIIIPLYFMGETHGYCVIGNCNNAAYTGSFQTWTTLLSYAVNSVYLRHNIQQTANKLEFLHERDSMTETYNRLGFKKHAKKMLETCIQNKGQMMILFADMDGMKIINDTYGHDEGDLAICSFSNCLKKTCTHGEIISRFGGDEMVVLGIEYSQELADDFANRFQAEIDHWNTGNKPYNLSVSVGYIVFSPNEDTDIEEYINEADEKMYDVKRTRKKSR